MISRGRADANGLVTPFFDWHGAAATIALQTADVLYIFDSCFARQLAIGEGPELLAAANWSSTAGTLLDTSFTSILAAQLEILDGDPRSVSQIFALIHREALTNGLDKPPIHVAHPSKSSIVLEKLQKGPERKSKRVKALQLNSLQASGTRVLISVRIQDCSGIQDLAGWDQWLTSNVPPSVNPSLITVEAQFEIGSHLLLVSLPVDIWTCLPTNDTTYNFVAFVESGNLLLQQARPSLVIQVERASP
jgi:hypothetical protein